MSAVATDPEDDIGEVRNADPDYRSRDTWQGFALRLNDYSVAYDALSIRQPWVYSILRLGKRIENRNWPLSRGSHAIGRSFGIHAAQKLDDHGVDTLRARGLELPAQYSTSGIAGVAKVVQAMSADHALRCYPEQAEWITGPLCLVLDHVLELPHKVGCPGALGWWLMSDSVRLAVAQQVRERLALGAAGE